MDGDGKSRRKISIVVDWGKKRVDHKIYYTSAVYSFAILPSLPPPWLVRLMQVLQLSIARNEMAERNEPALRQRIFERERCIKVGERTVNEADAAKSVGCGEVGRREGRYIQPESMRGGEVEESFVGRLDWIE